MTRIAMWGGVAALALAAGLAGADEDAELVVEGRQLVTKVAAAAEHPLSEVLSGWRVRSAETRALQTDDCENQGFVFVDDALDPWDEAAGTSGRSCADRHGEVETFAGLRASMPRWSPEAEAPWTLEDWIRWSRETRQGAVPWVWESREMVSMTAPIGLQSRGMPADLEVDRPMQPWFEKGQDLHYTRVGQRDVACANAHEDDDGAMTRADHLSRGRIDGFPVDRLKRRGLGSIHRRLEGCMDDIRAVADPRGADAFTALEFDIAWRGAGLSVETTIVRS